ncbi:MAG: hypothetical protein DWQ01_14865 [Planctomycetota bacterium]|nr:MAG: hypothetical protein DWQ01_14865 [Planctomycetota bacterium]
MAVNTVRRLGLITFLASASPLAAQQSGSVTGVSVQSAGRSGAGAAAADSVMEISQNPAALGFFFGDGPRQAQQGAVEYTARAIWAPAKTTDASGRTYRNRANFGGGVWGGWATALDDNTFFGLTLLPGLAGQADMERKTELNVGFFRPPREVEIRAKLLQMGFNPALSWRASDNLSLGIGGRVMHTRLGIEGATEVDTRDTFKGDSPLGGTWGDFLADFFGIPAIQTEYDGDAESLLVAHLQIGALWAPREDTRVSFWYRSPSTRDDLEGHVDVNLNPDIGPIVKFYGLSARGDYDLSLRDVSFPQQIGLATTHFASEVDRLHLDFTWTDWSKTFYGWRAQLSNPTNGDFNDIIGGNGSTSIDLDLRWNDVYTFALGYEHDLSSNLTLRSGLSYQTNAATGSVNMGTVIFNRWGLAVGATLWGEEGEGDWHLAFVVTVPETYQSGNNEVLSDFSNDRYRVAFYSVALAYSLSW